MGLETVCTVRLNNVAAEGKAHCSDGLLEFRSDFRFSWKWTDLREVTAKDGVLVAVKGEQIAEFQLGDAATKWEHAIKNPKSRLDKLGLKAGHSYFAKGEFDAEFGSELFARAGDPSATGPYDIYFVRVLDLKNLSLILEAKGKIAKNGAIWVMWTKGRKDLNENHVRDFALENGLVDVKVASFSPVLSALKLVIPVSLR